MDKINSITLDGKTYSIGTPDSIFFAGDSWDRSVEYAVEPAISANADGSVTFNCNADDIKIGSTSLSNAINGSSTATYAVATANTAVNRIDSLESSVSYIQADTNELRAKLKDLDTKLDALSLVAGETKASPKEVGKAFAALAEKMKALQQKDTGGKITLTDLIEPGEAAWIEKMNLKTRRTGTLRKSRLLTV